MATIHTLLATGSLVRLGGGLEDWERPEREMYAFPHVIGWIKESLPTVGTEFSEARKHELGGIQSPKEQLYVLIHDFIVGEDMDVYEKTHCMKPNEVWVWELKTIDIRLFGWFYRRGIFVIANIDSAFKCKLNGLYAAYRDDTARRRRDLDLDEPKLCEGGYAYVL
jgi:hypothetical protein